MRRRKNSSASKNVVGEAVLIAAFSGRALAQSARRAGYEPLVADAFGDLDTQSAAAAFRVIDGAMETGFRTKPLLAALNELTSSVSSRPLGLVLGSGFEDKPRLIAVLAGRYRLLGNGAATYAACKAPARFFSKLDELGIAHPETQAAPPADPAGWLTKRIGGSGGRHIRMCNANAIQRPRRYFQKQLEGERLSVGGVFGAEHTPLAVTRQWISPSPAQPFRFGGAVSQPGIAPALRRALESNALKVASAFNLTGMASFDFIAVDGVPHLLEVNPRPGASLDVQDDDWGTQFRAHAAVCTGMSVPANPAPKSSARAMAILHADRGALTLGETPWPKWSADRGPSGTFIPKNAPLASVFAEAATADEAQRLAQVRLAELEDLIYEHTQS
jgi:predicted ATP-grasp superfamily ATP-dependent carboligase